MKKISINRIAEELNLSRNTVSKALSNSDIVSEETKRLVVDKAVEIGYQKISSELLQGIVVNEEKKIKNIAVVAHGDISSFWDEIALGVFDELNRDEFNVLYNFISVEDEIALNIPNLLLSSELVGIIFLNVFTKEFLLKIKELNIPIVTLDTHVDLYVMKDIGDVVLVEGTSCVYELTKSLIDQGKKKIGFIGDITYCRTVYDRYSGYVMAHKESNLPIIEELCITHAMPNKYYLYEDVENVLNEVKIIPDAVVCANDDIAVFVMNYYAQKGLTVPGDIAVCGFDQRREYAAMGIGLTTVEVNKRKVGARLAQVMLRRLDNMESTFEIIFVHADVKYGKTSPQKH